MKPSAFTRFLIAALLMAGTAGPVLAATPASAAVEATAPVADNPAAHPTFTVRVVGKGQPMLLIPGLNCPGEVWNEVVAHFQQRYQCHVVSLAGFAGTAPAPAVDPLLPAVRDQLLAYIKTQKLNKPTVVGHSLGGFLALWLSTTQPDALGPLVIVDSLPFLAGVQSPGATLEAAKTMAAGLRNQVKQGPMPAAAQRQMIASLVIDTARVSQIARWGTASDPATTAQAMYDMYTTDLRADLGRVQQPVLVLGAWAAYKQYGSTKESTRAIFTQQFAQLPQARIEMSEAGRHFLMYDDTTWFFAQTDGFLKQSSVARK
ncbi:alpha/beta fold hydrolase [Hymenobacter arizonensis]|uniref:Pimeloyl-ACP methyl ester carboxylesterase n=1 Tax=Hymenobacter arizonensis TaxID=1227077 RepID=A0A1I6A8J3_HYMAR|nr:alpha/beta hydrolase [Hymenobacter arizonensis]SFQ64999.1 Pimeloyl-ACP methyl ester carboxylesterase [Hymenobacter arizonensis]